ncbi:class I SAM-dependent methyltransferase [Terrabacter aeriphilus]|uniref:class I SAM-dependent methyltransferase n=1 Tax=Terrabacter aeriphilus TaxID=515662 RepID=UPI0031E8E3B8
MDGELPAGARWDRPAGMTGAAYDAGYVATASTSLLRDLAAQAYGEDYPREVEPFGMTTWWVLGQVVAHARVGPGHRLVDLACGRGGPGLWLARATGASLVGVDWSSVAVEASRERAASFVPEGRARFVVGDLAETGLPDGSADAVVCLDAIFFAPDRVATLREVRRVLRPGGRFVFTASEGVTAPGRHAVPDWEPLLSAAGLTLEWRAPVPGFAEHLRRMYALWLEHLDRIVAELGPGPARSMEQEARSLGPTLQPGQGVLVVARRPGGTDS